MKSKRLASELQLLVGRHGFEAVNRELRELKNKDCFAVPADGSDGDNEKRAKPRRERIKAPEYVRKLDMDAGKFAVVVALAERFEGKSFLPRCADINNFCAIYGIEPPASKSRAGAIPRLFKYLAALDTQDVQEISNNNAFAGPSQLGPLAEAIRNHGRAARAPSTV